MKRKLASFLMMLLMVGCVQTPIEGEKPEEPPVVEQPEKPEEAKYVKKIDENKDWVYIETEYTRDLSDVFSATYGEEQLKKDLDLYSDIDNYTLFFDYHFPIKPVIQDIVINIDSEEAKDLNFRLHNDFNNYFNLISYNDGLIQVAFHNVHDDILSMYLRSGKYRFGAGVNTQQILIYNFDLTTGNIIPNKELLDRLNIHGMKQLKDIINNYYKSIGYPQACDGYNFN